MTELAHILIVEDDALIRRVYRDVLANNGYRVSLSGSGEEALAYLQTQLGAVLATEDAAEGLAAFFQKRTPVWKGR